MNIFLSKYMQANFIYYFNDCIVFNHAHQKSENAEVKSGLPYIFVNKVDFFFFRHSHVHSFTYCLWLISATTAELNDMT